MEENYLFAFSTPVLGSDENKFNRWYDDVHVPEVLAGSGLSLARRYVRGPGVLGRPEAPHKYLAMYSLGSDPSEPIKRLEDMAARDAFTPSDTNDISTLFVWHYKAL